jgi:hypothetical protein
VRSAWNEQLHAPLSGAEKPRTPQRATAAAANGASTASRAAAAAAAPLHDRTAAGAATADGLSDVGELLSACSAYVETIVAENSRVRARLVSAHAQLAE